jgi:TetR/AcrR family transcriptional regulator
MSESARRRMSAEDRERQILETAKTVIAASNYRAATTARIAAEAGVTEPIIYNHFKSKKDLFLGVLDDVAGFTLDYWKSAAEGLSDPVQAIRAVGRSHFHFILEHQVEAKILFQAISEVDDPDIKASLNRHFGDFALFMLSLLDEGKKRGEIREDVDTLVAAWELLALGITSTFFGLLGFGELVKGERGLRALEDFIAISCTREALALDEKGKDPGAKETGGKT